MKLVYDGFYKVYEKEVEIKGSKRVYEQLDIKSAVSAILVDEENKMCLVSQYRPIIGKQTLELPAGMIDKQLSNIEILKEELLEECDLNENDIIEFCEKPIYSYYMYIGCSTSKMEIYHAKIKKQISKKVDDVDVDEVIWLSVEEFEDYISKGMIQDAKTFLGYNYFKQSLKTGS